MARQRFFTALLSLTSLCWAIETCSAAGKKKIEEKRAADSGAVEKVLRAEVAGEIDRRERLAETLKRLPDSPSARWQAGFVKTGDSWRSFDDPQGANTAELLEDYRLRRAEAPQTFHGQWELANWCRRQGLKDQERAHLSDAVSVASEADRERLLHRLGFQAVGSKWLSMEQLVGWRDLNRRIESAIDKWGPKLDKISEKLVGSQRQHAMGLTQLKELTSPDSIPAIEYALSGREEVFALAAVEAFEKSESCEGTLALAKQASFSKWPSVRQRATAALKARRCEDFVPALIGLLATPATGTFTTTDVYWYLDRPYIKGDGGNVFFVMTTAFVLARETDSQFEIAVLHTVDHRLNELFKGLQIALDGGETRLRPLAVSTQGIAGQPAVDLSRTAGAGAVFTNMMLTRNAADFERSNLDELYKSESIVDSLNERTEQLNRQVISVLAGVTGRDPSPDPATWWKWWSDFSDSQQAYAKPVVTVVDEQTDDRGDPTKGVPRVSCFAAGTPVWTESGAQSIETIQVGDRVLAKDVESGELAYKPVLQTTVRPPKELTTLRLGDETIVCTGGHRFWSSGSGWIKARDLTEQTLLHTVTGNTPVWSAKKGNTAETYNLVVADFHTYFVGKTGVLCQDLLIPQGTNSVVPGLPRARAVAQK